MNLSLEDIKRLEKTIEAYSLVIANTQNEISVMSRDIRDTSSSMQSIQSVVKNVDVIKQAILSVFSDTTSTQIEIKSASYQELIDDLSVVVEEKMQTSVSIEIRKAFASVIEELKNSTGEIGESSKIFTLEVASRSIEIKENIELIKEELIESARMSKISFIEMQEVKKEILGVLKFSSREKDKFDEVIESFITFDKIATETLKNLKKIKQGVLSASEIKKEKSTKSDSNSIAEEDTIDIFSFKYLKKEQVKLSLILSNILLMYIAFIK